MSLVKNGLPTARIYLLSSAENKTMDEGYLNNEDKRQDSAMLPFGTSADFLHGAITSPLIESYPTDAFTAMMFCFAGFEDDMIRGLWKYYI